MKATSIREPVLGRGDIGDVVAVEVEPGVFCYLRKYVFGHGVLPLLSKGGVLPLDALPTLKPSLFIDVWVCRGDPTPMALVGSTKFENPEESWGAAAFEPPDPVEPCFRIHGVFNGVFSILKPMKEEETAGLRRLRRFQPHEFKDFLRGKSVHWPVIEAGKA